MINKTNDIAWLKEKLKENSLKATPQRIAVHKAMLKLGHASADMVSAEISANDSTKITVASVYNILSDMASLGIYDHRLSSTNKMFFDVNTFEHAHMYDCENDIYRDVIDDGLMAIIKERLAGKKFRGYEVEGIDIQIIVRPSKKKSNRKVQ